MKEIINDEFDYIKKIFKKDFSSHDFQHSNRVYNLEKDIAKTGTCNIEKICLEARLHNVNDYKLFSRISKKQDSARLFLEKHNFKNSEIKSILDNINNISFTKSVDSSLLSIEAKIVQDTDRINAIGAIVIARTCYYGDAHNKPIYDENNHQCYKSFL